MLLIDTEGFDPLVLRGGVATLARTRYLEFEFHGIGPWLENRLVDVIDTLDKNGFDCYWAGKQRLWRITGCFDPSHVRAGWRRPTRFAQSTQGLLPLFPCLGCAPPASFAASAAPPRPRAGLWFARPHVCAHALILQLLRSLPACGRGCTPAHVLLTHARMRSMSSTIGATLPACTARSAAGMLSWRQGRQPRSRWSRSLPQAPWRDEWHAATWLTVSYERAARTGTRAATSLPWADGALPLPGRISGGFMKDSAMRAREQLHVSGFGPSARLRTSARVSVSAQCVSVPRALF